MDLEFQHFFGKLQEEEGKPEQEHQALAELLRIVGSTESLTADKEVFDTLCALAQRTSHTNVRYTSVKILVGLFRIVENVADYLDSGSVAVSTGFVNDPNLTLSCLCMLVVILDSERTELIDEAVKKGAIDILFRCSLAMNANIAQLLPQIRELCLTGLFALAAHEEYALRLHEKDIWVLLFRLYEDSYVSAVTLKIVKRLIETIGAIDKADGGGGVGSSGTGNSTSATEDDDDGVEDKVRPVRAMGSSKELLLAAEASEARDADLFDREGYSEEYGLLDESKIDEASLDLPSKVCRSIDRKGIMGMLLNVCQTPEQAALAELALSILGLLTRHMHVVITHDNRIIIVRVLLNLVSFVTDARLISVSYVLDNFLKQKQSRNIVLQCGVALRCATTGLKLMGRRDHNSAVVRQCLVQLTFNISQLPDGPAELSNDVCVDFLKRTMKPIAKTQLQRNSQGKERWSSSVEVISLLTLINIAIESPVMSSLSAANLHTALLSATKRPDELGLLAVLGSAFFVGKSSANLRSREFPRILPEQVDMLAALLDSSRRNEPSLGGIYWSTGELLEGIHFLVQAPHNAHNVRRLVPAMVATLRHSVVQEDAQVAGLAVEILLLMSYSKAIMDELVSAPDQADDPEAELLEHLVEDALAIVPSESRRSAETLIASLQNERVMGIKGTGESSLMARLTKKLSRGSLKKLSLRKPPRYSVKEE
ncbi:Uncharacterized protein SCF082_LOCUS7079 [Durusdinium trenchii]|uniref:Uncharacterized protein n=1 Tax=Durusdinium trenchii TaxID=1381693 RepID=A0ABP0IGT4_9DINO